MPQLLAFGDSNTHGSPPMDRPGIIARLPRTERWPGVCAAALGPDWEVIEEGLPGRTSQFDDPVMGAHMNARPGLRIALHSHGPLDVLAVMLGTNDLKTRFDPTPARITAGVAGLVDMALSEEVQARHGGLKVLLIAPPAVREVGPFRGQFLGAEPVADALPAAYRRLADRQGTGFLDAAALVSVSEIDGVHFDAAAHRILGEAVAGAVRAL